MFESFSLNTTGNRKSAPLLKKRVRVIERLEDRQLLAAMPLGALPSDTGEFLLGTIAVTPVLFESNGEIDPETQNWTTEEIDEVLTKVAEGVGWWSDLLDTLDTVHNLDFVIDDTFATTPFSTPYEPIDRPSGDLSWYAGGFLIEQGQGGATTLEEAVYGFNQDQREKLGTDWSFTIFIVDSSDDADGLFASGGTFAGAFAYAGGLFIVTPSTRPASTIAHEMGHIFWARDEYPGPSTWTDVRGYYDTQNWNAADNPTPGFVQEISIMRGGAPLGEAYASYVSPDSTLAMVGWQDTDGDGIFDVADVPLEMNAIGYFDSASSAYRFVGEASAVALPNRNSSGNQSDITLNRISQIQYRLDNGEWITAASPDQQQTTFDLTLSITNSFNTIELRAIDLNTGVTSPTFLGNSLDPAVPKTGATGVSYFDENENGIRDANELVLANTLVELTRADGSPIYFGNIQASELPNGPINSSSLNASLRVASDIFGEQVAVQDSNLIPDVETFQYYDPQRNKWVGRWNSSAALEVSLEEDVGSVSLGVFGYQDGSYARIEAYDAEGELLKRVTSSELSVGEQADLSIQLATGNIRRIRVYGYAGASVGITGIEFGLDTGISTDANGFWRIPYVASGDYLVKYQADQVIYGFPPAGQLLNVDHSQHQVHVAGALRVDSPQHNSEIPGDVNENGQVSATDALVVINDLSRYSPRVLSWSDPTEFKVDVNNDGTVSALDALVVINSLSSLSNPSGEWVPDDWGSSRSYLSNEKPAEPSSYREIENRLPHSGVFFAGGWVESEDSARGNESVDTPNADTDEEKTDGTDPIQLNSWTRPGREFASGHWSKAKQWFD